MSQLKVNAISDAAGANGNAITLATDGTCTAKITNNLSNRNKIINGGMTISQRNGTSAVQLSASEQYFIDRWENDTGSSFDMKCDASQSSEAPEGFANSMKFDCDGVSAVSGGHNGLITTFLEGQDVQDLKFGTSNAEDLTLSFYAKSGSQNNGHVYGIFLGAWLNGTRNAQTKGFTVTSSWQRFTMTFPGTGTVTSTGINNNNSKGMQIGFSLAAGPDDLQNYSTWTANANLLGFTGQDNFFDHVDNELYITGVQLEKGTTATDFEHRSYTDEFLRCARYCWVVENNTVVESSAFPSGVVFIRNADEARWLPTFPIQMRSGPSITGTGVFRVYDGSVVNTFTIGTSGTCTGNNISKFSSIIEWNSGVGDAMTTGRAGHLYGNGTDAGKVVFDAEL